MDNGNVNIKYQRGTSVEADVGWVGATTAVFFTNGWLNACVRLNDGSNSVPQMSLSSNILTISSVQQGDRVIFEHSSTGARDEIAVVKNFTWNDLQRLGVGNLEMHPDFSGLHAGIKAAIIDTIVFCLDPRPGRDQKLQMTNDIFPDSGLSSITYTNFHAAHTNLLQLDIPSCRSIGRFPWDYDHWHLGLETETLSAVITNKKSVLVGAVESCFWEPFPVFQSNTVSKLVELINTTHADTNISFTLSHTYEVNEGSAAVYVDPDGVDTLNPGDPIRSIRWGFSTNSYPRLSYPGQDDTADWVHGDSPVDVYYVTMFVNRNGKVIISAYSSPAGGQVSDALWE